MLGVSFVLTDILPGFHLKLTKWLRRKCLGMPPHPCPGSFTCARWNSPTVWWPLQRGVFLGQALLPGTVSCAIQDRTAQALAEPHLSWALQHSRGRSVLIASTIIMVHRNQLQIL